MRYQNTQTNNYFFYMFVIIDFKKIQSVTICNMVKFTTLKLLFFFETDHLKIALKSIPSK